MDLKQALKEVQNKMQKCVDHTVHEFGTLHTGKATPGMVEAVTIDAYGSQMRIRDVAAINTPDSRMIVIQPWDRGMLQPIEKGIRMANIGLNPSVDGGLVRCPVPELSKERRLELVKVASGMAEDGKVSVRSVRRDVLEIAKKAQKDKILSEDDLKRFEKDVQSATDEAIAKIDTHFSAKEKDLLQV
jgi:ribosome recycling factor